MTFARLLPILLPLAALLGCSGGGGGSRTSAAPAWEKFRHDANNTGQGTGVLSTFTPHLKWAAQIDLVTTPTPAPSTTPGTSTALLTTRSSPAIALDGTIFVASRNGTLAAVDPSGTVGWRVSSCDICSPPALGSFIASPAVYALRDRNHIMVASVGTDMQPGGGVFLFSSVGTSAPSCDACFRPQDANKNPVEADSIVAASFVSSPTFLTDLISANITGIFVGADLQLRDVTQPVGRVYALNSDATVQWQFPRPQETPIPGPVNSSIALGPSNTLYFTAADGKLYAVFPNGTLNGIASVGAATDPDSPLISSPLINATLTNVTVHAGTAAGAGTAGTIFAIHQDAFASEKPTLDWSISVDPIVASLTLGNPADTPTPLLGTPSATPTATATPQISPTSTPTPLQNTLQLFGVTKSGIIVAVEAATGALRVLPNAPGVSPPVVSSPALTSDGILLIGDFAGTLHAIRTDDGSELWSFTIPGPITSSPAIANDGTIYIVGGDGVLYAVSTQ